MQRLGTLSGIREDKQRIRTFDFDVNDVSKPGVFLFPTYMHMFGTVAVAMSPFAGCPLWICMLTVVPLWIALIFTVFGLLGMPSTWPKLVKDEILISDVEHSHPDYALGKHPVAVLITLNIKQFIQLTMLSLPRLLFPVRAKKFYKYMEGRRAKLHGDFSLRRKFYELFHVMEPSVIQPPDNWFNSHDKEAWLYFNGMATTRSMARATSSKLIKIFGRHITCIHNPTCSIIGDMIEVFLGRMMGNRLRSQARKLGHELVKSILLDDTKQKVVVVAHSQGTIVASNVLADVNEEAQVDERLAEAMKKLELYLLANCAQQTIIGKASYVENISNEWDPIAMLGATCPVDDVIDIDGRHSCIEGSILVEKSEYGHMIDTHYLARFVKGAYKDSRLHSYRQDLKG